MLEGLEILDVIIVLALSLVMVSLALAWATRTAVRLMVNLRDEETEHAHTRRRLEDVEAIRARHDLVKAAKRSAHGGYPGAVPCGRPHLKAVDAGGCAPPIIVTVDSDRATDRAYADAGIMPWADYVAKHGGED